MFSEKKSVPRVLEFVKRPRGLFRSDLESKTSMDHEPTFCFVTADLTCIDESAGTHLEGYACGTLSDEEAAAFKTHLLNCLACSTDFLNWKSLMSAMETTEANQKDKNKKHVAA